MDYSRTADGVLTAVGGGKNVESLVHCATRLRFVLKDDSKADRDAVRRTQGVITVAEAGGQFQVVIGNEVPGVYKAIVAKAPGLSSDDRPVRPSGAKKGSIFNRFVGMISAIFIPFVWVLAGTGLLKAFLAAAVVFGWLDATTSTYAILNAAADAFLNFLPLAIAVTAAKFFSANQFTSLAMAGALVYPAIVALNGVEGLTFFGIPVVMVTYVSSVLPVIVLVWVQSHFERVLTRFLHSSVRNFLTPLLVIGILVPLTFLVIGPLSALLSGGLAAGISWTFETLPWLGGAVMGGLWQVFVLFGLHWGVVPLILLEIQEQGATAILAPLFAAVLAQSAATLAVLLRARSAALKQIAGPAAFSGFLAGITEPAVYGVNLPLKRPFAFGIVGGVVGGAIIAAGGGAASTFVFPSLLGIPALLGTGSMVTLFLGLIAAVVIGFGLTMIFGFIEPAASAAATDEAEVVASDDAVYSPLDGQVVPLTDVKDPVFAGGGLGAGIGIVPTGGTVFAPFDGDVAAVFPSGHAIGLRRPDGAELLIHVGLDTVRLAGQHFTVKVEQGQQVARGDVLIEFDRDAILAAGFDLTTPVVVTNSDTHALSIESAAGSVTHGEALFSVTSRDSVQA